MPPAAPDRTLRRLVVELATADADDVEAILDELDERDRTHVKALLAEYAGSPSPAPALRPTGPPPLKLAGVSPWLADRILGRPASRSRSRFDAWADQPAPAAFQMTPAATEALRACAAELDPPSLLPVSRTGRLRQWLEAAPGLSRLKLVSLGRRP